MRDDPLYAKVDIEVIGDEFSVNMIDERKPRVIGVFPKYRATITVEFDYWVPDVIDRISKTGILK